MKIESAQGRKLRVKTESYRPSLEERKLIEGMQTPILMYPLSSFLTSSWVHKFGSTRFTGIVFNSASSTANTFVSITAEGGRLLLFDKIVFIPTVACRVDIIDKGFTKTRNVSAGQEVVISNVSIPSGLNFSIKLSSITNTNDPTAISIDAWTENWWDLTDEKAIDANQVMTCDGHSMIHGTKTIDATDHFAYMLQDYFRSRGYKLKKVNMAVPGISSAGLAARLAKGTVDIPSSKIFIWMGAANDPNTPANVVNGDITEAALVAYYNVARDYMDRIRYRDPESIIIMLGEFPVGINYAVAKQEANMVLFRQRLRQAVIDWRAAHLVNGQPDPHVLFVDLGGSTPEFPTPVCDRTVAANYATDWLHPLKPAHTLAAARIIAEIEKVANKYVLIPQPDKVEEYQAP